MLVNAAGIISYDNIVDLDPVEWERIVRVDQTGVFLGMRQFIPGMVSRGGGSVMNFSSDWGVVGAVGATAYNAAKGAVGNPIELFLISLSVVALFDFDKTAIFAALNTLGVISVFAHANVRADPPIWYS